MDEHHCNRCGKKLGEKDSWPFCVGCSYAKRNAWETYHRQTAALKAAKYGNRAQRRKRKSR